ncbi:MAG: response regulator, partial [Neptuniibacter sp.]
MSSILVVDDSASLRNMVTFTLKQEGYQVVEAVDGQDALGKAKTGRFDLVLTDGVNVKSGVRTSGCVPV